MIRNLANLLREDFPSDSRNRAVWQWQKFVGSTLATGFGLLIAEIGHRTNVMPEEIGGVVLVAAGLFSAGFSIGELNAAGRQFGESLEASSSLQTS